MNLYLAEFVLSLLGMLEPVQGIFPTKNVAVQEESIEHVHHLKFINHSIQLCRKLWEIS